MYEKNSYGTVKDYDCVIKNTGSDAGELPDNSKELEELKERLSTVESFVNNFSKVFKGGE